MMDRAGNKFFTCAAFASNQNRRLYLGNRFDHLKDREHLCRITNYVFNAAAFSLCPLKCAVLIDQRLLFERLLNDEL